jgi:hypothetical protein
VSFFRLIRQSSPCDGGRADYDARVIVRSVPDGLLLVTQPDHAALAADILERWDLGELPHPWRSVLLYATRQHDNGWLDVDPRPSPGADGRPYDFLAAPDDVRRGIWPRAAGRLARERPLAGALVAQHALTIYSRYETDPGWSGFFSGLAAARDRLLARGGALEGEARAVFGRAYDFLHRADLASLIFCNGWREPHADRGHRFILLDDTLRVAPDPFAGRIVDLRVRGRVIPDARYASDEALRQALGRAPERWLTGVALAG